MMQYLFKPLVNCLCQKKINSTFVLTVRYIALLGELRQKMDIAMRARGFRPRLNRRTLYVTAQSVALLLIHALLKAETAQMALKCRGFQFGKREKNNMLAVNNLCIERNGRAIIQDLSFTLKVKNAFRTRGNWFRKNHFTACFLGFVPVTKGEIKLFGKVCREEKDFAPFVVRLVFVFKMPMINFWPNSVG